MVERQGLRLPLAPDGRPPIVTDPGERRHPQGGGEGGGRSGPSPAAGRRGERTRSRCPRSRSPRTAAAPTATPASPPTRPSGGRWTSWVRYGGTGVLAETPETYGAEHLLVRRASARRSRKLLDRYRWWDGTAGASRRWTRTPPREQGGRDHHRAREVCWAGSPRAAPLLSGTSSSTGEPITDPRLCLHGHAGPRPGLHHRPRGRRLQRDLLHHRPGLPSSGSKPVPSIKLATNSPSNRHMEEDMDLDCVSSRRGPLETVGRAIFEEVVAVASGKRTKSEQAGVGEEEFRPLDDRPR